MEDKIMVTARENPVFGFGPQWALAVDSSTIVTAAARLVDTTANLDATGTINSSTNYSKFQLKSRRTWVTWVLLWQRSLAELKGLQKSWRWGFGKNILLALGGGAAASKYQRAGLDGKKFLTLRMMKLWHRYPVPGGAQGIGSLVEGVPAYRRGYNKIIF